MVAFAFKPGWCGGDVSEDPGLGVRRDGAELELSARAAKRAKSVVPARDADLPFLCEHCSRGFATNQAARQHERIAHGRRTFVEQFIGDNPVCPVCSKKFETRLRAIAHLNEGRVRSKTPRVLCKDVVLSGAIAPAWAAA